MYTYIYVYYEKLAHTITEGRSHLICICKLENQKSGVLLFNSTSMAWIFSSTNGQVSLRQRRSMSELKHIGKKVNTPFHIFVYSGPNGLSHPTEQVIYFTDSNVSVTWKHPSDINVLVVLGIYNEQTDTEVNHHLSLPNHCFSSIY